MFKDRAVKIIRSIKVGRVSKIILLLIFCISILGIFGQTKADTISDKQAELDSLQQQINNYSAVITQKQQEAASLQSQIGAIDASLEKTKLEIQRTQTNIDKNQLEIDDTQKKINDKQKEMDKKKDILKACIQTTYEEGKKSTLEILISSNTLSDFMDQLEYISVVEDKTKGIFDEVKKIKEELAKYRKTLEDKKSELVKLKTEKETEQRGLEGQIANKQSLLNQTKGEEATYQARLAEEQGVRDSLNSEIASLSYDSRSLPGRGGRNSGYIWPVSGPITAYFRDPTYSYGIHDGLDIGVGCGTPVVSATNGVVARASYGYNGGFGNTVWVWNGNDLVIYGHFSGIASGLHAGQGINQGQLVGYVGNTGYSFGCHLHFQINANGNWQTPVDPLNYLP